MLVLVEKSQSLSKIEERERESEKKALRGPLYLSSLDYIPEEMVNV